MKVEQWKVKDIFVGVRTRKRCTEIGSLAESIKAVGLLQPIVIDDGGNLLAGQRRFEACKFIGWTEIPCAVASLKEEADPLTIEHDENVLRVPFSKSELTNICHRLMVLQKAKAKERQAESALINSGRSECGTVPHSETGKARDAVGKAVGLSGKTAEKLADIGEAAEESEELYGDLPAMTDTKGVQATHKELERRKGKKTKKVKPAKLAVHDGLGNEVPDEFRDVFSDMSLRTIIGEMKTVIDTLRVEKWAESAKKLIEHFPFMRVGDLIKHAEKSREELQHAVDALLAGVPYAVCSKCNGKTCGWCRNVGHVPQWRYEEGLRA